jgi:hypothetical protein
VFCGVLGETGRVYGKKELESDSNRLLYDLGWGLYWYEYGSEYCTIQNDTNKVFANRCIDYYCSCVELQQKSIFTFLWFWNQTLGGVKDVGVMMAKMVWEGREENLVKSAIK